MTQFTTHKKTQQSEGLVCLGTQLFCGYIVTVVHQNRGGITFVSLSGIEVFKQWKTSTLRHVQPNWEGRMEEEYIVCYSSDSIHRILISKTCSVYALYDTSFGNTAY